jgi:hypothetical protein
LASKVWLAHVAGREQVEMPPGAGQMEVRLKRAPVFALVRAGAALHHTAATMREAAGNSFSITVGNLCTGEGAGF